MSLRKCITLLSLFSIASCAGNDDKVVDLPGLSFKINYDIYSGYLNANTNGTWKMHYWLTESKSDPSTDPILVWFNGGPGCSSFAGSFEELGPFYVNYDGQTLYENKYSWNAKANVLFLESPIGVGFSYDTTDPEFSSANDERTMNMNYLALQDFFQSFPQYSNRSFFLSGESYAGVYIPMLSSQIAEGIANGTFPNTQFAGSAIGNGFMHVKNNYNSLVLWSAYHGKASVSDWRYVKENCQNGAGKPFDVETYDYVSYMKTDNGMDYYLDGNSTCGQIINSIMTVPDNMDAYNYYQDCWAPEFQAASSSKRNILRRVKVERPQYKAKARRVRRQTANTNTNVNTAGTNNYESTDTLWGYPCWNEDALNKWVRREDVQKALHIDSEWKDVNGTRKTWNDCNDPMYETYNITYPDQTQFFEKFFKYNKNPNFRFLVYNGDVDTVCNYLGDAWFLDQMAQKIKFDTDNVREQWQFQNQTAGFIQRYTKEGVSIDLLTVKGAGHFVPLDRPGASCQMITNFMLDQTTNGPNYNSTSLVSPDPSLSPFNTVSPPEKTSSAGIVQNMIAFISIFIAIGF